MANNYLQFATSFPLKTRAEQTWCTKTMNTLTAGLAAACS